MSKVFAAGGITMNGTNPWDIQVHNEKLYDRILSAGSIGFGEAYMEGWWDCESIDEMVYRIQHYRLDKMIPRDMSTLAYFLRSKYRNLQTKKLSKVVAKKHYNLGNDLFAQMLDNRMIYTCAYWENAETLEEAQDAKLDLICRKLKLEAGMTVLDLGCGWGGFAKFAAEKYGVSVVGVNISEEQVAYAREATKGLSVEIRLMDYRDIHEQFDRVVAIGLAEHIGYRNYRSLMETVAENLKDDGIAMVHTIAGNYPAKYTDPWIDKYIFPNGHLPSASQLSFAWKGILILEDWHNFGPYYDRTCMEWLHRFENGWDVIKNDYDESFYRMWRYYLSCCAASFRSKKNHLWQIVLTKQNNPGMYKSIR